VTTLAFDTETRGLDWFDKDHRAFLVSWADETCPEGKVAQIDDPEGVAAFREAVDRADRLVAHNLAFDVHHVREALGLDLLTLGKPVVDTDHLARVVVPERGAGAKKDDEDATVGFKLKNLGTTYVRKDAGEAEQVIIQLSKSVDIKLRSTGGYYDTFRAFREQMEEYARIDSELAFKLLPILEAKLTPSNSKCWELERAATPTIIQAEQRGVALDQEKVVPLVVDYTARREVAHDAVVKVLGDGVLGAVDDPDDKDSAAGLRDALLRLGVPLHRTTPKGDTLATNQFALQEFAGDFPVITDIFEYRTASKFLSTYLQPMVGRETVHPSFWQIGAWTGRMSCSRPNMQNIPVRAGSEVREMFVPRPGYSFVVCDFDSIELRLLAYYLANDRFKALIEGGADVFAMLAAEVYGPSGPLATQGYGPDPDSYRKGTEGEKLRSNAKNTTYAITYGAGAPRVADMLGISKDEAKKVNNMVKSWLPGYWDLAGPRGRIRKKVANSGYVTTIMGRKQPVKREKAYVGLNALIQGSAADIMKLAIAEVDRAVSTLGAHPVLFVHDEIVVECPTEYATECLDVVEAAMEASYDLSPALAVSGSIAHNSYAEGK